VSIHSALRPNLKLNITAPAGPDLLLVLFTQKKYLHNRKCGGIPRYASQKWMKVETTVMELGTRCTSSSLY
jgi:hypothetical protein